MTGNSANNVSDAQEAANKQKPKKADESMTTRAIRGFIEKRLSVGGDVFNHMIQSKCSGLETEFATFITQNRAFDEQSKEQQAAFAAVTSAQFFRETIALGAAFTSKRKALEHVISRGYDFTAPEMKKIRTKYESFSQEELNPLIRSELQREKFLKNTFPSKTLPYKSEKAQIEAVFGHNTLTAAQEEKVMNLIVNKYVDPTEIQEVLPLFNSTQKQLLLKIFLPTVTLGQLGDMDVLTNAQIKSALHQSIERGDLVPQFGTMTKTEKDGAVDQIDPYDIIIETMLFPQEVVDTILEGDGSKVIAQELSRLNTSRYEDALAENALKMQPTDEGLFLPVFQDLLANIGIKNTDHLRPGSIIKGKNKKNEEFAYRIDALSDTPEENKKTRGSGPVFTMTDILLSDGSLHLYAKKDAAPSYSYTDIYNICNQTKESLEILTPEVIKHQIDKGALKETLLENDITSLADLNRALDSLDPKGRFYQLKADGGVSLQVGEPGDKDFGIFQIKSINEEKKTIELIDRGQSEILDFVSFYSAFQSKKQVNRLPSMKTGDEFLLTMSTHGTRSSDYTKLAFDGDKIIEADRKGEKDYQGVTEFFGTKGCIKIQDMSNASQIEFLVYDEYDEKEPPDKQKEIPTKYIGGFHVLYNFLNKISAKPKLPDKSLSIPDKKDTDIHYHKDRVHNYFGNPSLHDILHAGKGIIDAIKHKMEHGSHLQAAHVQLSMAKGMHKMGLIGDGLLREMRTGVHVKNKKLMQEMVDEFKNMSATERQEEVMHILSTVGTHDYEVQAATMAILQSHGSLYVGDLKKWEGSFIFFERISGMKYSPNLEIVRKYKKYCLDKEEPFTEEGLIISYLKGITDHSVDPNLWKEMAKSMGQGAEDEIKKGEAETAKYGTHKGRLEYVIGKFKGNESMHAIGGFESIWNGGGPAHEMHLPAIILALSDIHKTLGKDQLTNLKNKFGGGHPYTALLFLGTPGNSHTFRAVLKKIAISNGLALEYQKIEDLQKKDPKKALIPEIIKFWTQHGAALNKKLNVTEDGELLHLAKTDSDCQSYLNTCKVNIGGKLNDTELGNGAYEFGSSSLNGINPEHYLNFIEINPSQGTLNTDREATKQLWPTLEKSIEAIRGMSVGTEEDTQILQKELYFKYHRALMQKFNSNHISKEMYTGKLQDQDYIQNLDKKYGIKLTPYGRDFLESSAYQQHMEENFTAFLRGGRGNEVDTEKKIVKTTFNKILDKNKQRRENSTN